MHRTDPLMDAPCPSRRMTLGLGWVLTQLLCLPVRAGATSARASAAPGGSEPMPPSSPTPTPTAVSNRPLRGTYWKLLQLAGQPVQAQEDRVEPHLLFDTRSLSVSGSGGCNRFSGRFKVQASRLSLGPLASTRMACAQGMAQESAVFASLERVAGHRIEGERLSLLDAGGQTLLALQAVDLR